MLTLKHIFIAQRYFQSYENKKSSLFGFSCLHRADPKREDFLFSHVWQECHETGLLDRGGKFALMLCANVRVTRINDLCLARNKTAQKIDLFVVDIL